MPHTRGFSLYDTGACQPTKKRTFHRSNATLLRTASVLSSFTFGVVGATGSASAGLEKKKEIGTTNAGNGNAGGALNLDRDKAQDSRSREGSSGGPYSWIVHYRKGLIRRWLKKSQVLVKLLIAH